MTGRTSFVPLPPARIASLLRTFSPRGAAAARCHRQRGPLSRTVPRSARLREGSATWRRSGRWCRAARSGRRRRGTRRAACGIESASGHRPSRIGPRTPRPDAPRCRRASAARRLGSAVPLARSSLSTLTRWLVVWWMLAVNVLSFSRYIVRNASGPVPQCPQSTSGTNSAAIMSTSRRSMPTV